MATDELLLHRYSNAGDPAAFRGLVDRYAGMVYSISLRITGDRHIAEDVSQDCFLELACKAPRCATTLQAGCTRLPRVDR